MLCYVVAITQHTTHRITPIALHKWITTLTLCNTGPQALCGFAVYSCEEARGYCAQAAAARGGAQATAR